MINLFTVYGNKDFIRFKNIQLYDKFVFENKVYLKTRHNTNNSSSNDNSSNSSSCSNNNTTTTTTNNNNNGSNSNNSNIKRRWDG